MEGRGQITEGRRQKAGARGQRTEGRGQITEGRRQKAGARGQRTEGRGQITECRRQKADTGNVEFMMLVKYLNI